VNRLKDKVAIITGATSGLGLACAELFLKEGASLVITGRNAERGQKALDRIGSYGPVSFIQANAGVKEDAERAVQETADLYGGIDVLVNNAGWAAGGLVEELAIDVWNSLIQDHLTGSWMHLQAVIPHMKKRGGGSIISMSSIAYWRAVHPDTPVYKLGGVAPAYGVAKAGLEAMTRKAAGELGQYKIRCNTIQPGMIRTELSAPTHDPSTALYFSRQPLQYSGTPEDVAYAALYLASDESKFVTGTFLRVDGGFLIT